MKKTLSIILALSLVVSMMVGLSFSASAGVDDYLANYDFTVADSSYVPAANNSRVDAAEYVNPLGFNAYLAMADGKNSAVSANTNNNTTELSYFKNVDSSRKPDPKGLAFGLNGGTFSEKIDDKTYQEKGRVTLTYAIPEASAGTETMVYEFSVLGQNDMRATAFGLSTADASTIATEMTSVAVVNPTSNSNNAAESYVSNNRLFLARFNSSGSNPNLFSSASTTKLATLTGPQVNAGAGNGYNGYNVRIEYTPSYAENNLYIAMRTYNNESADTPSSVYSTTVTVNVPEGDNPWPTHLFVQTVHGLTGSNNSCDLRYLRIFDKADEEIVEENPESITISGNNFAVYGEESTYSATVMGDQGNAMAEEDVTWNIVNAPSGVSINNGVLTIADDAVVSDGAEITITAAVTNDLTINTTKTVKVRVLEDGYLYDENFDNYEAGTYDSSRLGIQDVSYASFNATIENVSGSNNVLKTGKIINLLPMRNIVAPTVVEFKFCATDDVGGTNARFDCSANGGQYARYWIKDIGLKANEWYTVKHVVDLKNGSTDNNCFDITGVFGEDDTVKTIRLNAASGTNRYNTYLTKIYMDMGTGSLYLDDIKIYTVDKAYVDAYIAAGECTVENVVESTMNYEGTPVNAYTVFVTLAEDAASFSDYGIALFIGNEIVRLSGKNDGVAESNGRFGVKFFVDPDNSDAEMYGSYTIKPYIDIDGSYGYGNVNLKTQDVSAIQ